jgi:hypothetical protein
LIERRGDRRAGAETKTIGQDEAQIGFSGEGLGIVNADRV